VISKYRHEKQPLGKGWNVTGHVAKACIGEGHAKDGEKLRRKLKAGMNTCQNGKHRKTKDTAQIKQGKVKKKKN
jgi:hypothetical protein